MSAVFTEMLGALPIRERPSEAPSTAVPEWLALVIGLAIGIAVVAGLLLIGRRRQRRRQSEESRAWTAMDQLCPEGWTAELTLYGSRAPLPGDAPGVEGIRVRVDWAELTEDDQGGLEEAVVRRFWSRSVAAALRTMVQDRELDHQLEEIERSYAAGEPPESG